MSIKSLESLEAWKKAKEFALRIYREVLPSLPPKKSGISTNNYGAHQTASQPMGPKTMGRFYYQENIRFCYNASQVPRVLHPTHQTQTSQPS